MSFILKKKSEDGMRERESLGKQGFHQVIEQLIDHPQNNIAKTYIKKIVQFKPYTFRSFHFKSFFVLSSRFDFIKFLFRFFTIIIPSSKYRSFFIPYIRFHHHFIKLSSLFINIIDQFCLNTVIASHLNKEKNKET